MFPERWQSGSYYKKARLFDDHLGMFVQLNGALEIVWQAVVAQADKVFDAVACQDAVPVFPTRELNSARLCSRVKGRRDGGVEGMSVIWVAI
jgi:hypothetical protein